MTITDKTGKKIVVADIETAIRQAAKIKEQELTQDPQLQKELAELWNDIHAKLIILNHNNN